MTYNPFATLHERKIALDSIVVTKDNDQAESVLRWIIEHYDHAHSQAGPQS